MKIYINPGSILATSDPFFHAALHFPWNLAVFSLVRAQKALSA